MMEGAGTVSVEETTSLSAEQRYLASMKLLQFGECCNILESVSRTMNVVELHVLRVLMLIVTDVDGRVCTIATLLASVCLSCTYAFK